MDLDKGIAFKEILSEKASVEWQLSALPSNRKHEWKNVTNLKISNNIILIDVVETLDKIPMKA